MSLFKKKQKSSSDKRKKIELIFDSYEKNALAFGLQWRSIVTADVQKTGTAMARAQAASHIIFRGQQVGFGSIDPKESPRLASGAAIYAAAQVAGRQYGGNSLFVVQVAPREYWIALVRNGLPTSTDIFLTSSDDSQVIQQANTYLAEVSDEALSITIYTNLRDHGFEGVVKYASVEDILLAATNEQDRVSAILKQSMTLPVPVLVVLGAGALLIAGQQGFKWWEAKQRLANMALNKTETEDPAVAWARAVSEWEATSFGPSSAGLLAARESIGHLPVLWSGWRLVNAGCAAVPLTAPAAARPWSCTAAYARPRGAVLNREMVSGIPEGWNVTFSPLKGMSVSWSLSEPIAGLKVANLLPTKFHNIETTSQLQAIAPAFSSDIAFVFSPVAIPPPKGQDGTALPMDPSASGISESRLVLTGPLRSVDALIDRSLPADWSALDVRFSDATTPSIISSAVMAEVKGVVYAKD